MLHVLMMITACAANAGAQAKPKAPAAPTPVAEPQPAPARAPATAEPINIRYQIVIRETGGPRPGTKTVTLTIALNDQSVVRAQGSTGLGPGLDHPLNVDVMPTALRDTRVRTRISVEYRPEAPEGAKVAPFYVRQTLNVWLEAGKPMVISEAADPISDRRLSVEVTATIIR